MEGAVGITGTGIICATGNDTAQVLDSLRKGESGIAPVKYLSTVHSELPVGEIKLSTEEMKRMLGIPGEAPVSRTSVMGAIAVREAIARSGVKDLARKRVVLISGTTVGVMDVTEQYHARMKTEPGLQYLPHSNECGRSTQEIARYAGIPEARCCTVCTACSSALNAIMLGAQMLRSGEADIVIAGGSEPLSRYHLNGFNSLMILDSRPCRPFDESRAGLNLGEGAAFVVLEKDPSCALAYVRGSANRCDAFHQTATSKDGDGAFLAMSVALEDAGLKPSDIDYVNAHGTATPDNDSSESAALRRVFGDSLPPVSSTKSYTGHTTSAAGSVETVICVLAMTHDFIPASLGWSKPFEGGIIPTPGRTGVRLDNVMCNSFGFGGNDSSLVLSRERPVASRVSLRDPSEVRTAACVTVDSDDRLAALKDYMSAMETRRLSRLMKAALLSAFEALGTAGISSPDAIVAATSKGMLELSTRFLDDVEANGEQLLKPTLFMQSTHNTIASAIAIRTGCHGYNITYSHGDESSEWALRDAHMLLRKGEARNVLVCEFDEDPAAPAFRARTTIYTI